MSREEMADATLQIAQEYSTSQNLDVARQQLADLDVANVNQWLLYVADTHTAEGGDAQEEQILLDLANALGLNSASVVVDAAEARSVNGESDTGEPADGAVDSDAAGNGNGAESGETESAADDTQPVVVVADLVSADDAESSDADSADVPATEIEPVETPADTTEAAAEETTEQAASLTASNGMNVRSGPGLAYTIVGAMQTGETAQITGKNSQGDWWQVTLATGQPGWVYSPLVTTAGDTNSVAIAADIPTPPPVVPTAEPVAAEPAPEEVAAAPVEEAPAEAAPAEAAPAEEAPAEAAPAPAGPDFVMIERRLWGPEENGGRMEGTSVVCGEKRQLQVYVLDAAGNLLNGVAVQAVYGNQEIEVTGAQGKGEGMAEFVLGDGQDVKVIRDTDGRDVSSDVATNLTTKPYAIDFDDLIQAGYCTDAASCQKNVVDVYACGGHYSWTVKFQRSY